MAGAMWRLQDAKNQFSRVVTAAEGGRPQFVSRRGRRSVVILSVEEYERLRGQERQNKPSFIEHLLAAPKRPPEIPDDEELFSRGPFLGRELDFEE